MFNFLGRSADMIREKFAATRDVNDVLSLIETSRSFELAVNMGLVPGYSTVSKFGENPDIDTATTPEDISEIGGTYTYDVFGTAPIVSLISDDGADTMLIEVTGLDINGNEVVQNVQLTGLTRVALPTALYRVYRMANLGEIGEDIAGTVYWYVGVGGVPSTADTRALINNGNNQTLMALYTVPTGKVGFLYHGEIGISRGVGAGEARAALYSAKKGKVSRVRKRVNASNSGSSVYQDKRSFPDVVPALTDLRLSVESVSANGMGVTGGFDVLLVDEDQFTAEYLTAIGQPS
jgi:hypothetical protein